ncbi:MAG: EF-P beta-lysylation protein EpmB, partial [Methylococcaceae bacterium]|nr:EF-P beta-lysylation protein EpmB [Methylococcaceae bacterium]
LFEIGVMPYYLHLLDKAQGTAHFEVSRVEALLLMEQVQAQLSGYLVPKLVQEEAGANSKTIIF